MSAPSGPVERLRALTERQGEILAQICGEGLTYKEVGRALGIGEQTVKKHVSTMLARAGAPAATVLCAEWGRLQERGRGEEIAEELRTLDAMRADCV